MAGHNKWSKIKRLKGALDAKRGALFSRFSREITVAAKNGGGDPTLNPRLRSAILVARKENMPNDNIERAIKKGTGELASQAFEELVYEGYAPGGIALLIEAMTDNRNRTAADLRLILSKNHGNLATSGSVAYLFHKQGQITVPTSAAKEEVLFEIVLEAGAEELTPEGDHFLITTAPDQLYAVGEVLKSHGIPAESLKLVYLPETTVAVTDEATATQVLRLCDALEECDDVQSLHANFDISDELLSRISA